MNYDHEEALIFDALSAVETPRCDLADGVKRRREQSSLPRRSRHRPKRTVLIAACLLLALAVSAAAVAGISGLWRELMGDTAPAYAVSTVGVSQTSGEYTLTIDDAVVGSKAIMMLVSLSRTDGQVIDPEASISTYGVPLRLFIDEDLVAGLGLVVGGRISEDGTTLQFLLEGPSSTDLLGQTVTLSVDGVVTSVFNQEGDRYIRAGAPVSLAPLAGVEIPDITAEPQRTSRPNQWVHRFMYAREEAISIPIPMQEATPYRIRGAAVTGDGLALMVARGSETPTSGEFEYRDIRLDTLVDTRDGARYKANSQGSASTSDYDALIYSFSNCPLSPEELSFCEVEVSFAMDRVLSRAPFSLTFSAQDTGSSVEFSQEEWPVGDATLHAVKLYLSPIGIQLSFQDDATPLLGTATAPVLHFRDGTSLRTVGGIAITSEQDSAWLTWPEYHSAVNYVAKDAAGQRIFLDVAEITALTFGDLTLPVNP